MAKSSKAKSSLTPIEMLDRARQKGVQLRVMPEWAGTTQYVVTLRYFQEGAGAREGVIIENKTKELRDILRLLPGAGKKGMVVERFWEHGIFALEVGVVGVEEKFAVELTRLQAAEKERIEHYTLIDHNFNEKVLDEIERDPEVVNWKQKVARAQTQLDIRREQALLEREQFRAPHRYLSDDREL